MAEVDEEHLVDLHHSSEQDDSAHELDDHIQLEVVGTVLKISDLFHSGETKTLYNARHARKGRMDKQSELSCTSTKWLARPQPNNISWWLAVVWITGSALFVVCAVFQFIPFLKGYSTFISFCGAILWSIGGFLSYFEVINAVNNVNERIQITKLCVFRPYQVDWWIGVSTFLGTICIQIPYLAISFFNYPSFSYSIWLLCYYMPILLGTICLIISSLLQLAEGSGKAQCLTWNPREPWYWSSCSFILASLSWGAICVLQIVGIYYEIVEYSLFLAGSILYLIGSYALIVEVQN